MNESPAAVGVESNRPRPRVTLKLAQSLDGRIATAGGHARWISNDASRTIAHGLRSSHEAVLVGIGTVLADDPQLNVRLVSGPNPVRVVVDSHLRLPLQAAVLAADGTRVIVLTLAGSDENRAHAIRENGAEVLPVPAWRGRVDLDIAFQRLSKHGITSLLVEGGAQVATEIIRRRLVDEMIVFIAPKIIGAGIDAVGNLETGDMSQALQFSNATVQVLDGDIVFRGKPRWPEI